MAPRSVCYKYSAVETVWGYSSVGRASRSHREGQGFESPYLHLYGCNSCFSVSPNGDGPEKRAAVSLIELLVATPSREVLVDITQQVQSALAEKASRLNGVVSIFIPHTTAGVTINEGADPSVAHDIIAGLARLVPKSAGYLHSEGNSDAHIKTSLIGNHVTVPVGQGRLRLGTWQSIYLAEFDGPRKRAVWLTPIPAEGP